MNKKLTEKFKKKTEENVRLHGDRYVEKISNK